MWFDKKLNGAIDVLQTEVAVKTGKILKRELLYAGSSDKTILFNMKIYDTNIEMPSAIKPLIFDVPKVPYEIEVDGAKLSIQSYDSTQLRYFIIQGW